jgi:type VII secretion integral membrane protein EccD
VTSTMGTALAKVTINTPQRGIDVALPEHVPIAELLPYILRHAGEGAADTGEQHGGWALRRVGGERLDPRQTLGAHKVRDGEILHLVPGQVDWPEIEYDDLVEAIASGARRYGRSWGNAATRRCGLAAGAVTLLLGVLTVLYFQPPWLVPGLILLIAAVVLLVLGVVLARAVSDAQAGAVFAGAGLPYAFLGGALVSAPDVSIVELGSPQWLAGSVVLAVFGILGYAGVAAYARVFIAAVTVGVLGAFGALLGGSMSLDGVGALVLATAIALLPGYPMLAIRLGRLPLPQLPQRATDLLSDDPAPPAAAVFVATARADEILSGLLLGLSVTSVVCAFFLAVHGGGAQTIMLVLVALALLLRARVFPVPRQRLPLLVSGGLAALLLAAWEVAALDGNVEVGVFLLVIVAVAGLSVTAGVVYSKKNASPWLGRIADVIDVVAMLALIPFAAYLTGFFAYVQGLMASIG